MPFHAVIETFHNAYATFDSGSLPPRVQLQRVRAPPPTTHTHTPHTPHAEGV